MDYNVRKKKEKKSYSKKEKKLIRLINNSDSENEDSEHELSHYLNDRVKLMKEVLKIIKPKKIKSMAPDCMKDLEHEEINSMLLEELLGISNKRLKYIFNGQNLEEDSSSTDPEQEPVDIISLDDISDDDFIIDLDSDDNAKKEKNKKHKVKVKDEHKRKKIKKEKPDKGGKNKSSRKSKDSDVQKSDEQNLMSVLELLELQARARAIRSQLALENKRKEQEKKKDTVKLEESDNEDAIIIESPKNIEIVITSSDSENDSSSKTVSKNYSESTTDQFNDFYTRNGSAKDTEQNIDSSVVNTIESNEENSNPRTEKNQIFDTENSGSTKQPNCDQTANTDRDKTVCISDNERNCNEKDKSADIEQSSQKNSIAEESIASTSKEVSGSKTNKRRDKCIKRRMKKSKEAAKTNKSTESHSEKGVDKTETVKEKSDKKTVNVKDSEIGQVSTQEETKESHLKSFKNNDTQIQDRISSTDDGEGIVINVDQSEIDCIISD